MQAEVAWLQPVSSRGKRKPKSTMMYLLMTIMAEELKLHSSKDAIGITECHCCCAPPR